MFHSSLFLLLWMTEPEHTTHPSLISPAEKGDEVFQPPFSFSCSFLFPDIKLFGLLLFHNLSGLGKQVEFQKVIFLTNKEQCSQKRSVQRYPSHPNHLYWNYWIWIKIEQKLCLYFSKLLKSLMLWIAT